MEKKKKQKIEIYNSSFFLIVWKVSHCKTDCRRTSSFFCVVLCHFHWNYKHIWDDNPPKWEGKKYTRASYAWIFRILVLCISIFLRITSCSHSMKTGFVGAEHNNWTKSNAQKREMFTFFLYFTRKKAKRLIRDTRKSWTQGNVRKKC